MTSERARKTKPRRAAQSAKPRGQFTVQIKRVYEKPSRDDGERFLVDRLWPRGVPKRDLSSVPWMREVAPSAALRKWYGHDPEKWAEFRKRFREELRKNAAAWEPLVEAIQKGNVTLLTASRDVEISNATVLKEFLLEKTSR